ncbi:nucleoside diphosphate kinase [Russula vinacea]|nr:nucleoside diphosphate kinase [Russula vinacea]
MSPNHERTYIMVKPDGVQRGLVGNIIDRFEKRDYEDLKDKPFFPGLIKYMASGPVVAMVWQGLDAVKTGRVMLGATNPLASAPGTYYSWRLCLAVGRNICHGSDSVDNAEKEISCDWFPEGIVQYEATLASWIFE